jgi:hypothetical protein
VTDEESGLNATTTNTKDATGREVRAETLHGPLWDHPLEVKKKLRNGILEKQPAK